MQHKKYNENPSSRNMHQTIPDGSIWIKVIGCVVFMGLLLFMAGVELNPGPVTPVDDKTKVVHEGLNPGDAQNITPGNMPEISAAIEPTSALESDEEGAHYISNESHFRQRSDEHVAGKGRQSKQEDTKDTFMQPLIEAELVEFADYIPYDNQERLAIMLGFDLNKVEILRGKHRENVTGVSLDLLLDWMKCNPQPTNRQVSVILKNLIVIVIIKLLLFLGLPRSMPNADQCRSTPINANPIVIGMLTA